MPYSPYMYRYSASETAPLRKIERLYMTSYNVFIINITCSAPQIKQIAKNVHFVTLWLRYENLVEHMSPI